MNELIIFILAFIAPLLYWRILYYLASHLFNKPFTRTKTGLQVHHGHYGIIFILISSVVTLFTGETVYMTALLGLGLGLILDEFIPSLLMPGDRTLELEIYRRSLSKTIIFFSIIIAIILLLSVLTGKL